MKKEIIKTGVVAEFNGRFWGVQYEDGHCTEHAFGPIEKAKISDPAYCHSPTDLTWIPIDMRSNPDYEQLKKARLVKITITTTYEVGDSGGVR